MVKVNRKFMIGIILIGILLVVSLIIFPFVSGFGVKSVSNNNIAQVDTINIAHIKDTGVLDISSQQEDGYDNTGDSDDNSQALKDDYGEEIFTDRNIKSDAEDNQTEDNDEEEEPVNVGHALEEDQDG